MRKVHLLGLAALLLVGSVTTTATGLASEVADPDDVALTAEVVETDGALEAPIAVPTVVPYSINRTAPSDDNS